MPNALIPSISETVVSVVPLPCAFVVVTVICSFDSNLEEHASPVNQGGPVNDPGTGLRVKQV
jgi:hypothetical protein